MKRDFLNFIICALILLYPVSVGAVSMNSNNFIITSDDFTQGGGFSNSSSFVSQGDIGGTVTGEDLASSSYRACAGYPCTLITGGAATPSITFTVTPNSINLGTLAANAVATGDVSVSTSTTVSNGYVATCLTDGEFRNAGGAYLSGVADGTVTAGANEYGIGLTGTDRAFADDRAISTSPLTIASNGSSVTNSSVTVTFKAAISATNAAGAYSQIATFISSASF